MDNDSSDFRKSTHNKLYDCNNGVFHSWLDLPRSHSFDPLLLDAPSMARYGKGREVINLWNGFFVFSRFDSLCTIPKSSS